MTPNRTLPPATAAARIAPLLLALAGLAIAAGSQWLWRHRRQIGAALVATAAATYSAGAWLRQQIEALATDSARRIPAQPITALSPITATLAAAWGLVDRFTTTRAKRAQQALLADIANAYGLEPRDLLRPIEFGYSTAAVAAAWGLVDRGAMTRSDRARQALLADIASNLGDDLVSKIMKAIDENNVYLKQAPKTITLSTQNSRIDNTEDQLWLQWLRDHGWTVVE